MEGQSEYAFWHMLVRDVAYGQIPRAARIAKHTMAAEWIEAKAGERVEDLADVLAHHYTQARQLAESVGERGDISSLTDRARHFLSLAAERALELDPSRAAELYGQALELSPTEHEDPRMRLRMAEALKRVGEWGSADRLLREAIESLRGLGDAANLALALIARVKVVYYLGVPQVERKKILDEAEAVLAGRPLGEASLELAIERAYEDYLTQRDDGALAWVETAVRICEELGIELPGRCLTIRGGIQSSHGDPSGIADLMRVIELASKRGTFRDAVVAHNDLADGLRAIEGAEPAMSVLDEGWRIAERSANLDTGIQIRITRMEVLRDLGRWVELLEDGDQLSSRGAVSYERMQLIVSVIQNSVHVWRGDPSGALAREEEFLSEADSVGEMQVHAMVYGLLCHAHMIAGAAGRAGALLGELLAKPLPRDGWIYATHTPLFARATIAASRADLAKDLLEGVDRMPPAARVAIDLAEAHLLEANGEIQRAVAAYASAAKEMGPFSVPEQGQAFLGHGRCLSMSKDPSARKPLQEARRIFGDLSATPYMKATDDLIAGTAAGGS